MSSDTIREKTLCAIDIGTSKVVALLAELNDNEEINIIGIGTQPSKGLKKGVIVNIDATVKAIQRAIQEAEDISGFSIKEAYIGIAGSHIHSFDSHGVVAIENSEVSQRDLEPVIESAKAVPMPADQEILHILLTLLLEFYKKFYKKLLTRSATSPSLVSGCSSCQEF